MMKRIIALLLAVTMLMTCTLTGCSAANANTALSMGQWVSLLADSFGMQNYLSDKPYFKNITQDNAYFAAFQMAAEWEILEPSEEIRDTTTVKYKDVLVSLVNAGGFLPDGATEEEKIDYAINAFDSSIRKYWMNRDIRMDEAITLLDTAQKQWAEKQISNPVHEAKLADSVKNYLDTDLQYTEENGRIKVDSNAVEQLNVGDVFALPCSGESAAMIKKVTDITYESGNAYIQYEDLSDEELAQYAENIVVRDTTEVDFSNVVGIYDENGNPIVLDDTTANVDQAASRDGEARAVHLGAMQSSDARIVNTGIFDGAKGEYTFTVKGNKFTITLSGKSFGVKWSKDSDKKNNQYRDTKKTTYISAECSDFMLTKDIDISWGKIKSALIKFDYKMKIQGGVKVTTNNKVGVQDGDGSNVTSSINSIVNGYKDALKNVTKSVKETKYTNDSVYICRIKLVPAGLAAVDFIVKGVVTVTGELKIVIEFAGCQGIEYKNGQVRYIKANNNSIDLALEGKIEATLSPGFAITLLDRWQIGEVLLDLGAGTSVTFKAHLFDEQKHLIYTETNCTLTAEDIEEMDQVESYVSPEELEAFAKDKGGTAKIDEGRDIQLIRGFCLEWKLYPIVRLSMGDGLLPNLLRSNKVSLTLEFLGEKNTKLTGHIDFDRTTGKSAAFLQGLFEPGVFGVDLVGALGVGKECSFDFKPWDDNADTLPMDDKPAAIDSADILTTDQITLSEIRVTLTEGETGTVTITGLPAGYKVEDIHAVSADETIATIDIRYGRINTYDKAGTTMITVKTKDGKFQTAIAVTVVEKNQIAFSGIPGVGAQ